MENTNRAHFPLIHPNSFTVHFLLYICILSGVLALGRSDYQNVVLIICTE